jgi:catechol 2,3-dioxygenase-like lactoylglutathione lyase family enzyme
MEQGFRLGNVMVDCDDALKLRDFYADLLQWEKCELYGLPAARSSSGIVFLFIHEDDYVPPVWPETQGGQQKQMHFDFQVKDLPLAVKRAEALGAAQSASQFGGQDFITILDPAGHPFCLCRE